MIAITYVSIATSPMTNEALLDLLKRCVRNNQDRQITGMLLYKEGKFMQILEGPKNEVLRTFQVIERDPRHYSVIKLFDGTIKTRLFPKWTMGFRDLDAIKAHEIPGYDGFLNEEPVGQVFPMDPARASKLLGLFSQAV